MKLGGFETKVLCVLRHSEIDLTAVAKQVGLFPISIGHSVSVQGVGAWSFRG